MGFNASGGDLQPSKLLPIAKTEKIIGHKYSVSTVSLCVNMYLLGGCGFRGVVRMLEHLRFSSHLNMPQIPCKSSIENWVMKCGHFTYTHPDLSKYASGYALIIDECMVIGQERMLIILAIEVIKGCAEPLNLSQAEVISIAVKPSWTGEQVKEIFQKVAEKVGRKAEYIICDGGTNLGKGITDYGGLRICDCGHEMARQTEQVYKEEERYTSFCKAAGQAKLKEVMKETSYLTPPKQRSVARFMNLSFLVDWGKKMLKKLDSFSVTDQNAFGWIKEHKGIIGELDDVVALSNSILKLLKTNGLSHKTIKECESICSCFAQKAVGCASKWIAKVQQYLHNEFNKLPDATTIWHASSDIIESLFGLYKAHKADNAMYGVTPFVLTLSAMTKIDAEKPIINIDIKAALEGTYMADLHQWNKENLIENQVVRRRKALKI